MYNSQNVAKRIKELAKTENIAIKDMLSDLDLGINAISTMRNSFPKSDTLARIADYLGCSVDYLLGRPADGISPEEQTLLDLFRACSDVDRAQLLDLAELYAGRERSARSKRAE